MGFLFSKPKVTEHDKAVLELKVQRDKLKVYQRKIQVVIDRETDMAKELLRQGKRDKAVLALRKKKYQQGMLDKSTSMLDRVQEMVDTIEYKLVETKVVDGLKAGNESLKALQKELGGIDAIERLMDDTAEALEYQKEIDEMLGMSLSPEDDLAAQEELEALQRASEQAPATATGPDVSDAPAVPSHEPEAEAQAKPAREKQRTPALA